MTTTAPSPARDYRVDFVRGLALLFIFINHVPGNIVSFLTLRTVALCDASEVFIFMAGFSAALVFCIRERRIGFLGAAIDVWRRTWSLYVVHIFVFVLFVAQVAWTAARVDNPAFVEEMLMAEFLTEPHIAVVEAL
ncbi:MAG: OpgC domain-containing protein, partial [Alphaproteobacteria bacterium]|nr:OpgC domain-containing protein [Alphaproteobacteria bacterium]